MIPDAHTRVAGVVGHPVGHSLSPAIQNAALRRAHVNAVYLAFDLAADQLEPGIRGLVAVDALGVNITIPHKQAALALADRLGPEVERTGAANTLVFSADGILAHNTDLEGFSRTLTGLTGPPSGMRCLVLGAGGAGRAVVWALSQAGARHVSVANRTFERAAEVVAELASEPVDARAVAWDQVSEAVDGMDVIVNTTSVGMDDDRSTPVDAGTLRRAAISGCRAVVDVVYRPSETRLVHEARAAGVPACDGLGILVHQGAAAFELFTGLPAPTQAMMDTAWQVTGRGASPRGGGRTGSAPPIV